MGISVWFMTKLWKSLPLGINNEVDLLISSHHDLLSWNPPTNAGLDVSDFAFISSSRRLLERGGCVGAEPVLTTDDVAVLGSRSESFRWSHLFVAILDESAFANVTVLETNTVWCCLNFSWNVFTGTFNMGLYLAEWVQSSVTSVKHILFDVSPRHAIGGITKHPLLTPFDSGVNKLVVSTVSWAGSLHPVALGIFNTSTSKYCNTRNLSYLMHILFTQYIKKHALHKLKRFVHQNQ